MLRGLLGHGNDSHLETKQVEKAGIEEVAGSALYLGSTYRMLICCRFYFLLSHDKKDGHSEIYIR